jgi:acyl-CoA hydrolase
VWCGQRAHVLFKDEQRMALHRLETTLLIWPNEMNVHGTLFGGIVTRTAVEVIPAHHHFHTDHQ